MVNMHSNFSSYTFTSMESDSESDHDSGIANADGESSDVPMGSSGTDQSNPGSNNNSGGSTVSRESVGGSVQPYDPRNKDLLLLTDIELFMDETGKNPVKDADAMEEFVDGRSGKGEMYDDLEEVNAKIEELREMYEENLERQSRGENVERDMDQHEKEIWRTSQVLWADDDEDEDEDEDNDE